MEVGQKTKVGNEEVIVTKRLFNAMGYTYVCSDGSIINKNLDYLNLLFEDTPMAKLALKAIASTTPN